MSSRKRKRAEYEGDEDEGYRSKRAKRDEEEDARGGKGGPQEEDGDGSAGGKPDVAALLAKIRKAKEGLKNQLAPNTTKSVEEILAEKKAKLAEKLKAKGVDVSVNVVQEAKRRAAEVVCTTLKWSEEKRRKRILWADAREQAKQTREAAKPSKAFVPPPLILDQSGREVDAHGNVVAVKQSTVATSLINKRKAQEDFFQAPPSEEEVMASKFFDPRMKLPTARRDKRTFKFVEAGRYVRKAERMRAKAQIKEWQEQAAKKGSVAMDVIINDEEQKLFDSTTRVIDDLKVAEKEHPTVEWWDASILHDRSGYPEDDDGNVKYREEKIHSLVLHPVLGKPPGEPSQPVEMPVYFTKKEFKKMRRMNRAAKQKERQELIMAGLEVEGEARMNMNNYMKVKGDEAIQDPTKVDAMVKAQMKSRLDKHKEMNEARKLTPEERREKKLRKLRGGSSLVTHVALFGVKNMSNPLWRKKIDFMTRDGNLSGVLLLSYGNDQLVLVEGGAKAIKKFKGLMLRRINWTEERKSEIEEEDQMDVEQTSVADNRCNLVWEGTVLKPAFKRFAFHGPVSGSEAREFLAKRNVPHYWDQVQTFAPVAI